MYEGLQLRNNAEQPGNNRKTSQEQRESNAETTLSYHRAAPCGAAPATPRQMRSNSAEPKGRGGTAAAGDGRARRRGSCLGQFCGFSETRRTGSGSQRGQTGAARNAGGNPGGYWPATENDTSFCSCRALPTGVDASSYVDDLSQRAIRLSTTVEQQVLTVDWESERSAANDASRAKRRQRRFTRGRNSKRHVNSNRLNLVR